MKVPHFFNNYRKHIQQLLQTHDEEQAMVLAVGGDFEAVGLLEYFLLLQYGLQREHTLIDVGCGSGRLAFQLKNYLKGLYVGIDGVSELFQYAQKISDRPDWKFYEAPGLSIPEPDDSADFICFFSVFTHLTHEESFKYLEDARRVIKPKGKIIFSFLEFLNPSHWHIFESSLNDTRPDKVLTQFVGRDAIEAWAKYLNLSVLGIIGGDEAHIQLEHEVRFKDGRVMKEKGNFDQSLCVLTKR